MKQYLFGLILCVGALCVGASATQPLAGDDSLPELLTCPLAEPLRVGAYNWAASRVMRATLSRLLEHAYGCEVEVLEGLPQVLEMALLRGELDVLLGVSSETMSTQLRDALATGELSANLLYQQQAGFFISEGVVASLDAGRVSDLAQALNPNVTSDGSSTALDIAEVMNADATSTEPAPAETAEADAANANGETAADGTVNEEAVSTNGVNIAESAAETPLETSTETSEMTSDTPASATPADASVPIDPSDPAAPTLPPTLPNAVVLPNVFINCPLSWQCYDTNVLKLAAYGFDVQVVTPENASAVSASLQAAQAEQRPWFGFLWTPSWLVPTFSLVRLDETPYSDACWQADRACAYPADDVLLVWRADAAAQLPEDMRMFVQRLQFADVMSALLAVQQQGVPGVASSDMTPEDRLNATVTYFLQTYPEVWQGWLEPAAAARVSTILAVNTPNQTSTDNTSENTDEAINNNESDNNENTDTSDAGGVTD